MSKPLLAEDVRVGATLVGSGYDIERVTADPRLAPGLAADLGTVVEYVSSQGSVLLAKYTTWNRGWRSPGGGPLYPNTADLFLGATQLTASALYLNDQMTGDVFDASGNGNNLTVTNTPTFQQTLEDKVGIWYDAAADRHSANVNDPGASSFIWGGECALISDPGAAGNNCWYSRIENTAVKGYYLVRNSTAAGVQLIIRDAAGNVLAQTFAGSDAAITATPRVPYLISGQVDRTAGRLRGRMSRGGAVFATIDAALGAVGNLSFAGQVYGFGGLLGVLNGGNWSSYGYYCVGAQTEGANALRDLAVGLGWEV